MIHNAMPVLERLDDPASGGYMTASDTGELIKAALAPLLGELAEVPELQAAFARFGDEVGAIMTRLAREHGRLMTDSPMPTPAPDGVKDE